MEPKKVNFTIRDFSLHGLTNAQQNTIDALQHVSLFDLLPTHCINADGELEGFHASFDSNAPAIGLPINRSMFHGHSVFECLSEERIYNTDVHRLSNDINKTRSLMQGFLKHIGSSSIKNSASLSCMPDYSDEDDTTDKNVIDRTINKNKYIDSKAWIPEVPRTIGIYHAYIRGHHQRSHRLFIVVSGGLEKCGNEYYNMVSDVAHASTCQEIVDSQETWWLRKANQRARARLAYLLAHTFDLKINSIIDNHDFNQNQIATALSETIENEIKNTRKNTVSFFSSAVDTTTIQNGLVCQMHPSEGVWIFRGEQRNSAKPLSFGSMFGSYAQCGLFPTRSPCYIPGNGYHNAQVAYDSDTIVRHQSSPILRNSSHSCVHQNFDEKIKKSFEKMGWNRENNILELVPIIVGVP